MIEQALKTFDPEADVLTVLREVSDVRDMAKDGKTIFDPKKYPKYMGK